MNATETFHEEPTMPEELVEAFEIEKAKIKTVILMPHYNQYDIINKLVGQKNHLENLIHNRTEMMLKAKAPKTKKFHMDRLEEIIKVWKKVDAEQQLMIPFVQPL